jgi:1,4-alpha-glucan branching enzyme
MRLTDEDLYLFHEGSHFRLHDKMGARLGDEDGRTGCHFAVWAPNAAAVSVIGDWNGWDPSATPLSRRRDVWEGFVAGVTPGQRYKFRISSQQGGHVADKADPFGLLMEEPPSTASTVWDLAYAWGDAKWMEGRAKKSAPDAPVSIYELHLGSWRRKDGRRMTYREIAPELVGHVKHLGFTHVELMPVMEHPFYGSWGYQITGYFAPSRRYGVPQDLMWLIDQLHQNDIGVILDWVPGHFPDDPHGLGFFDGTHLFEHKDPRQGWHPEWNSLIFNYGRHEVKSFLISNAMFWLDRYHADGLRIDGVASMLYLDYARKDGEWVPNKYGGRENLDAVGFLRRLNDEVHAAFPGTVTIAEDSTAWPMVTRPTEIGGLGFRYKWDMGWMHDMLRYLHQDPIHRKFHHNDVTFRSLYQYAEAYVLPLSHDEVVHLKGSLLAKMAGDPWQMRANLRLLFGHQWLVPGKKLLFMGGEFGQWSEWSHESQLEWHLVGNPDHDAIQTWVKDLNRVYRELPALHAGDCDPGGYDWIDGSDVEQSVISFLRMTPKRDAYVCVVFNFTPIVRHGYGIGVPCGGFWEEVLNSDAAVYGGSGVGNYGGIEAEALEVHGKPFVLRMTLPPLGVVAFRATKVPPPEKPKKKKVRKPIPEDAS